MMRILLFLNPLLKCFIYRRVKASYILHGATISNTRIKDKSRQFLLILNMFPSFQIIYQGLSNVWILHLVNVSSKLSTSTLRFPHCPSMNTTLSKSSKFSMSSISLAITQTNKYASLAPSKNYKSNWNCK